MVTMLEVDVVGGIFNHDEQYLLIQKLHPPEIKSIDLAMLVLIRRNLIINELILVEFTILLVPLIYNSIFVFAFRVNKIVQLLVKYL